VDVAFVEQTERGHGVEQHRGCPIVGFELVGELFGQDGLFADGGPEVKFGRGADDAGGPKAVHEVEDLLAIGMCF
jgi:hypothetical protein